MYWSIQFQTALQNVLINQLELIAIILYSLPLKWCWITPTRPLREEIGIWVTPILLKSIITIHYSTWPGAMWVLITQSKKKSPTSCKNWGSGLDFTNFSTLMLIINYLPFLALPEIYMEPLFKNSVYFDWSIGYVVCLNRWWSNIASYVFLKSQWHPYRYLRPNLSLPVYSSGSGLRLLSWIYWLNFSR